jgi:sugar-specific transcriptional regulator TrmB
MAVDVSELAKLGFSKLAIDCYGNLYNNGSATAAELSQRMQKSATNLYRSLQRLSELGFVTSLKTDEGSTYFLAVPVAKALVIYSDYQRHLMLGIISSKPNVIVNTIISRVHPTCRAN